MTGKAGLFCKDLNHAYKAKAIDFLEKENLSNAWSV